MLSDEWQNLWDKVNNCYTLKLIRPKVGYNMRSWNDNRAEEVIFHRLRLGVGISLNSYLHKINKSPDDLCVVCFVSDTVCHFLLHCKKYKDQRADLMEKLGVSQNLDINFLLGGANPPFEEVIWFVKQCKVDI